MRKRLLVAFLVLVVPSLAAIGGRESSEEMAINEDGDITPLRIPRLTSQQKWELIRQSGQDPEQRRRPAHKRRNLHRLSRRALVAPWRLSSTVSRKRKVPRPLELPIALSIDECPVMFDAVTKAFNGRTYVFSGSKVYQIWYDDNLPYKASYEIRELFPGGPQQVNAVLTNKRSGITTLFHQRKAYRFRWHKKAQRFHMTKNRSQQDLPRNITLTPTLAFEWFDGNQVIIQDKKFAIYDSFWNLATFHGDVKSYFPNVPRDLIGVTHADDDTALLYTRANKLKVYHTKKYRVVQEYPVKIGEFVGCL